MSLKEIKLSEMEELITQVEHQIIQLQRIVQYTPSAEKIVIRLEKSSELFDQSVKHGLNKLEKALLDIDYSKINSDLAEVVRHQVSTIIQAMDRIQRHQRALDSAHDNTGMQIKHIELLTNAMNEKISTLKERLSIVPAFDRRLAIGSAFAGFVAGVITLYLLSLVTWLPTPYFATQEQTTLLDMVKNQTLRIEGTTLDSFKVRVDFETQNTQSLSNTGDNQ
jgi:hypothetical protein